MNKFDDDEFKEHLKERHINIDPENECPHEEEDVTGFYLNLLDIVKDKSSILNSAISDALAIYPKIDEKSPLKKELEVHIKELMELYREFLREFNALLKDLN